MKLAHVEQLAVLYEPEQGRRIRVGRLARKQRQILFEYDGEFLARKLELSPFHLTFASGPGGEHTTLVAGEGRKPGGAHLMMLASELEIRHAAAILEDVRAAVRRFKRFADKAGVPPRLRDATAKVLAGLQAR